MSMVSVYCLCDDGKWYKNPVWEGEGWFVCLDDKEPPELVCLKGRDFPREIGGWFSARSRWTRYCHRMLGGAMREARSRFGYLRACPPKPTRPRQPSNDPSGECIIYRVKK